MLQGSDNTKNKIFVETSTVYPTLAGISVSLSLSFDANPHIFEPGELDTLLSSVPHTTLIMAPVFGAPAVAETGQLIVIMAGDYRTKKEVAHLLVPGVGRKVIDLGGNLEKGTSLLIVRAKVDEPNRWHSPDLQTDRQLCNLGKSGNSCGGFHTV